jgi:hypothetical protein
MEQCEQDGGLKICMQNTNHKKPASTEVWVSCCVTLMEHRKQEGGLWKDRAKTKNNLFSMDMRYACCWEDFNR